MEKVKMPIKISDSEWETIRVAWILGQTIAQEITQILTDSMGRRPTTIKALLGHLIRKEVIWAKQGGKKSIYYPVVSEMETTCNTTENLFSRIYTKRIGETTVDLVGEAILTQEDISKILKRLEQKQPVNTIECNCVPGQCECKQCRQKEEKMKQQFSIEGMSYNHCAARVEGAVSTPNSIQKVKVNLRKVNGTVRFDEVEAQSKRVCQTASGLGYEAEVI